LVAQLRTEVPVAAALVGPHPLQLDLIARKRLVGEEQPEARGRIGEVLGDVLDHPVDALNEGFADEADRRIVKHPDAVLTVGPDGECPAHTILRSVGSLAPLDDLEAAATKKTDQQGDSAAVVVVPNPKVNPPTTVVVPRVD
jgi:hypothetical protein